MEALLRKKETGTGTITGSELPARLVVLVYHAGKRSVCMTCEIQGLLAMSCPEIQHYKCHPLDTVHRHAYDCVQGFGARCEYR